MRAGELRHRITIQRKAVTRNGFGEEIIDWQPLTTTWASVQTLTGGESIEQSRAGASLTHRIVMRYQAGVQPEMQIDWASRTLEIHAVVPDAQRREMALECSEVV